MAKKYVSKFVQEQQARKRQWKNRPLRNVVTGNFQMQREFVPNRNALV